MSKHTYLESFFCEYTYKAQGEVVTGRAYMKLDVMDAYEPMTYSWTLIGNLDPDRTERYGNVAVHAVDRALEMKEIVIVQPTKAELVLFGED